MKTVYIAKKVNSPTSGAPMIKFIKPSKSAKTIRFLPYPYEHGMNTVRMEKAIGEHASNALKQSVKVTEKRTNKTLSWKIEVL